MKGRPPQSTRVYWGALSERNPQSKLNLRLDKHISSKMTACNMRLIAKLYFNYKSYLFGYLSV